MFVMNSTAIWVLITVMVLNIHHQDKYQHPPAWLNTLTFTILAKLVCMRIIQPDHHRRAALHENNHENDLLKCEEDTSKKNNSHRGTYNSWILMARVFDRLCLIIFMFVDLLAFIVLLSFYPSEGIAHPNKFPRHVVKWNFTDY